MTEVFADTGYFIAILAARDQHKARALSALDGFREAQIVTTEMVLVELFASLSRGVQARAIVVEYLRKLRDDPNVTIIPQTPEQFDAATQFFAQRLDQRFSLTDCASFLAMEERGISQALTFDTDFQAAGFGTALT